MGGVKEGWRQPSKQACLPRFWSLDPCFAPGADRQGAVGGPGPGAADRASGTKTSRARAEGVMTDVCRLSDSPLFCTQEGFCSLWAVQTETPRPHVLPAGSAGSEACVGGGGPGAGSPHAPGGWHPSAWQQQGEKGKSEHGLPVASGEGPQATPVDGDSTWTEALSL